MSRIASLIILSALIAVSCSNDDDNGGGNGPTGDVAYVRLLHANYDGGTLDLRVNGDLVKSNTAYPASSGYGAANAGRFDVSVHNNGDVNALKSSSQNLAVNGYHSVYAFPPTVAFAAGFSADRTESQPGTVSIKLVNASYNKDNLNEEWDLYITGKETPMFRNVRRLRNTSYFSTPTGRYSFTLRRSDDPDVVFTFEEVDLLDGSAYTLVLNGTPDEDDQYPFGLRMYNDDQQGTNYVDLVKAANVGSMMFIMAIHGSEAVNIAVDGAVPQITGLAYRQATNYLTFAAGPHTYGVEASSQAYLLDQAITLDPLGKYSVVLTGTKNPRDIEPLQLRDPRNPNESFALVRFLHLAPESGNVSVQIKDLFGPGQDYDVPGMQNIQYRGVSQSSADPGSNFVQFPSAGTYTVLYKDVAADSVVATQSNVKFELGKVYTLWYGGLESNSTLRGNLLTHE